MNVAYHNAGYIRYIPYGISSSCIHGSLSETTTEAVYTVHVPLAPTLYSFTVASDG